jgi:hypothetical protein
MNGMNAEECADKEGEPPIRHAGELCSYDAAARQRAPIGKSATACDFALCLMRGVFPISQVGPPEIDVYARSGP